MTGVSKEYINISEIRDLVEAEHEIIGSNLYRIITNEAPTIVIQLASLTALANTAAMVSTSLSTTYDIGPLTFQEYFIMEFFNQLSAYRKNTP